MNQRTRPFSWIAVVIGIVSLGASPPRGRPAEPTFLYLNNALRAEGETTNTVVALAIDRSAGALRPVAGSPFPTGGDGAVPGPQAVDLLVCCGSFLYATNGESGSVSGFSVDTATGVLSPVPGSPFPLTSDPAVRATGLACPSGGSLLYAATVGTGEEPDRIRILRIDPATGALSPSARDPYLLPQGFRGRSTSRPRPMVATSW